MKFNLNENEYYMIIDALQKESDKKFQKCLKSSNGKECTYYDNIRTSHNNLIVKLRNQKM